MVRRARRLPVLFAIVAAICAAATACGGNAGARSTTATRSTAAASPTTAPASSANPSSASGDWPMFGYDPQRSNVGPARTGINAANLGSLRIRRVTLPGIADSSAIVLGDARVRGRRRAVAFATTSYGRTVAVDLAHGRILWRFAAPNVNTTPGNPQVTTAAPAADPNGRALYAAAPNGFVYKLSVNSGRVVWARRITLDPGHEKLASSLNVSGRWVVAVTGGYIGDIPPYDGHVVTIDRSDGRIEHVWNSECSGRHRLIRAASCRVTNTHGDNAMWGRAGAVIEPGSHRILTATGNGPFNGRSRWGDSVLELTPDASRLLHSWTPTDQQQLDSSDLDVGSTSPALLGTWHGRRLAVQGGKAGVLDLLDLDRLDGTTHGPGPRLGGQLSEVDAPGHGEVFTAPAVWHRHGATTVFVGDDSGTTAYRLVDPRHPRLRPLWHDGEAATSPVLAGGLLYVYDEQQGTLEVRSPQTGALRHSFDVGQGHWNSPVVAAGRVVLPIGSYHDDSAAGTLVILHLPAR
ncbi:MAG TPA: PQQ-binding-like beta-propeller repeat protein [Solirubrobacteraceae bacterium]|nr:PQQ-binding-like beta-propeller repeat protein [Solirubrobacteraceae bacterium]